MSSSQLLPFASDYMEGAHPAILKHLAEMNRRPMPGYGTDAISEAARAKIRAACQCPEADVYFLVGGTQTNATVIDALLASYHGVVAADTGHISLHEAGAIEFGGHKVLTLPHTDGKLRPEDVDAYLTPSRPTATATTWSCPAWSTSPIRRSTARSTRPRNCAACTRSARPTRSRSSWTAPA